MNLSNTAIGGDNLIANSPREINQFISLKEPLETLVFGQKGLPCRNATWNRM